MLGCAEAWSHGTWAVEHSGQIGVKEQDKGYQNPSFLHLQMKGIPAGFRCRSAQKRTLLKENGSSTPQEEQKHKQQPTK
eukprot:2137325-Amphidinium_carterae.1